MDSGFDPIDLYSEGLLLTYFVLDLICDFDFNECSALCNEFLFVIVLQ